MSANPLLPLKILSLSVVLSMSTLTGCSTIGSLFKGDDKAETENTRGIPKKSEDAYYKEAKDHLDNQRFDLAEKSLTDLRTFYPVGKDREQAQLDLIYINYRQGEDDQVALAADRFIRLYPNNPQVDYAYYAKGVSIMRSGFGGVMKYTQLAQAHRDTSYLRSAFATFKKLVDRFPDSQYAPDAIERMHFIYNQFAESEINAARFNIRRKAYVGAAERARWVLQHYPQSPQIPEAIALLVYSYDQLGLTEQASKYRTLLRTNYPELLNGEKVNLKAARTGASWFNRLTLGVLGKPDRTFGYYQKNDTPVTGLQPIEIAPSGQSLSLPTTETSSNSTYTPSARSTSAISPGLSFGLGLPPSDGMSNQADAVNDAELQQEKTQEIIQQPTTEK